MMKTEREPYAEYEQQAQLDQYEHDHEGHAPYLHEEYPDLLTGNQDLKLVRLVRDLDIVCAPVQPPAHLSASIRETLPAGTPMPVHAPLTSKLRPHAPLLTRCIPWLRRSREAQAYGTWRAPRLNRPILAIALAAAVLCLMGAGYVALPALERLFEAHTGTEAIIYGNLGRQVNISQTVDGFTVAVRRVYADPNHVVIGLTVSGPAGRTFNHIMPWGEWYGYDPQRGLGTSPVLTDNAGKEFSGGMGGEQGGMQDGSAPYLLDYEGTGIGASGSVLPKEISARLKVGMLSAYEKLPSDKYQEVYARGPFLFDLTIPVESGRVADLHQTVEVGGHGVTLERVVTAPTGTRISLRGAGPNADVRLVVDGVTYMFGQPDGQATPFQWTGDSVWEYVSGTSLQDKGGEWELTVRPGAPPPTDIDPAATRLDGGPWTFKFTVPPAEQSGK